MTAPTPALAPALLQVLAGDGSTGETRIEGLTRLSGGASQQTWSFDWVQGDHRTPLILRRSPPQAVARTNIAAGLAAEAALIRLAGQQGVPVPALQAVLSPEHGLGEGFVMQRLAGETLGRRIATEARLAPARQHLARQCGQALARIHAMPLQHPAMPALRQAGPAAELAHYRQWQAGHGTLRPVFVLALQWLAAHRPAEPVTPALVHGDFRNGNLLVDERGLRGVLDWELAHAGDPMEDLGWLCVNSWRYGVHDRPVGGFGILADLFEGYRSAGGQVLPERVHWWQVMGTLKWGLICEDMLKAWLSGAERDVEKAAIGRRASEAEIDLLDLLVARR